MNDMNYKEKQDKATEVIRAEAMEQFAQIARAYPLRIDAGDLISKHHKALLYDMGLTTPKYGTDFGLTDDGREIAEYLGCLGVVEQNLGATGLFPDGRMDENDEGELLIAFAHEPGMVHVRFGKRVASLAMPPENARQIGSALLQHAAEAIGG